MSFIERFPWFSFLTQAPQALKTLTGSGIVLGSIMAFSTDLFWGLVRAPWNGLPRFVPPPAADPLMKAYRYLSQPPYHVLHSGIFSYEDHWLLAMADHVAISMVMEHASPAIVEQRSAELGGLPVLSYEAWYPPTRELLSDLGIDPAGEDQPPIEGMTARSTYGEVLSTIMAGYPAWQEAVRLEFPATSSATAFANVVARTGHDVYNWGAGGEEVWAPIYSPEELTFAHMFEFGVFPPFPEGSEGVFWFLQRAGEIARASGREIPWRSEMILAANELWGGFASS